MQQIGYSLIETATGNELQFWGDTTGQAIGMPGAIQLPNGNVIMGAALGNDYGGWKMVERWLDVGNATTSFDGTKVIVVRPVAIPQSVTPRQARLALNAADMLAQVETAIASADKATQIAWEFASVINRNDALVTAISAGLNLTSDQIDALFIQAATL